MNNFISKCNKKAYKSIKNIMQATNMIQVESSINTAIMHTFGTNNFGLIKIAMRKATEGENGYDKLLGVYGGHTYRYNFELLKAMRLHNQEEYYNIVKAHLMQFIPERLHKSEMYRNMAIKMLNAA